MKWMGRRQSNNVEDARGQQGMGGGFGGMGGFGGGGGGKVAGMGGLGLIIALVLFLLTGNPGIFGGGVPTTNQTAVEPRQQGEYAETEREKKLREFSSVTLADLEDTWNTLFRKYGKEYVEPKMVIYSGAVQSGCGPAESGMGPFYCPADQKVYLDLSFYDTLVQKYGAQKGDFILAYVIAHEVGHHVQTLLGVTEELSAYRSRVGSGQMSQQEYNQYSIRYELQADYLAGVFAKHVQGKGYLEQGDIQEALSAAAAVGDDHIQETFQGYANPDTFNHGTSQQRQAAFMKGFETGNLSQMNATF